MSEPTRGESRRLLLTVGRKRCPYRCSYCFADFSQYERPPTLEDVETEQGLLVGVDVLYPACDVDLFALANWRDVLERTSALGRSISLSTKARLSDDDVSILHALAARLRGRRRLLKVGVSFSTRTRVPELEARASTYADRIGTLRRLAEADVPTALVLRPLLADVHPSEYASIMRDARPFVDVLLTGPEHLDSAEAHPRRHLHLPHVPATRQRIGWARGAPIWLTRHPASQLAAVREEAKRSGFRLFESDLGLMDALATKASTRAHIA